MIFWLSVTAFSLIAAFWLARPLLQARTLEMNGAEGAISIYRDQLDEIDRDEQDGLINDAEAKAARIEVERRALHAARNLDSGISVSHRSPIAAAALIVTACVTSAAVYAALGAPGQKDAPLAERRMDALTAQAEAGDVASQIQLLIEKTRQNPKGFEDWWTLAQSYKAVGDHASAVDAYRNAAALDEDNPKVLSAYAEAMTLANGNKVPSAARVIFEQVARETGEPRARYYAALAMAQEQQFDAALASWSGLLQDSPPDAPWIATVRRDIVNMSRILKHDVRRYLPAATEEEILAANPIAPTNSDTIEQRIAAAETAIGIDPMDYKAWLTLAEAHAQNGEIDEAKQALFDARRQFSSAPFLLQKIAETEEALGLDLVAGSSRGPTSDDIIAASNLTQEERDDMIDGMVAGLAARLEEEPKDPDGWIMLIRSYATLGNNDKARNALGQAKQTFSNDVATLNSVLTAVSDLAL